MRASLPFHPPPGQYAGSDLKHRPRPTDVPNNSMVLMTANLLFEPGMALGSHLRLWSWVQRDARV
jgi:hypothetical protein